MQKGGIYTFSTSSNKSYTTIAIIDDDIQTLADQLDKFVDDNKRASYT